MTDDIVTIKSCQFSHKEEIKVTADIHTAIARRVPYSKIVGRKYLPNQISVNYIRSDAQPWAVESVSSSGLRFTDEGQPSHIIITERWHSMNSMPPWLAEFVEEMVPDDEY